MMAAQAAESGVLSRNIEDICSKLEGLAAHLAAWADFPDEDVEIVDIDEMLGSEVAKLRLICL